MTSHVDVHVSDSYPSDGNDGCAGQMSDGNQLIILGNDENAPGPKGQDSFRGARECVEKSPSGEQELVHESTCVVSDGETSSMQSLPSRTGKVMLMKGLKDVQQPSAARNEKVTENGKDVKLPSGACNETAMTRDHDVQRPSRARKNEGNILCQDAPMGTPRSGYASFSCREDTSVLPVFQDKPVSKGLRQAIILELCAGCAKLSSVCSRDGLTAVAIDHGSNKHTPRHHILNLDLSLEHSWTTLREICTLHHVIWVHIAPPCGTASRARDRPLTADEWGPRPLRSAEFPWGLPDLDGAALDRVTTANAIYWHTA